MARGGPVLHAGYRQRQLHAGARPPGPSRLRPWPAHCPLASLHGCRGSPGHGRWCWWTVVLVARAGCRLETVPVCQQPGPGQPWRLQPALRPPLPPLLATTRAAPPAAATLATQHEHTTTSRMNLHPPAHRVTGPPPPSPSTTSNHALQLYSQHGSAAPLHPMLLFLVTAKTFDQVYIPLLNIPLH